MDTQTARIAYTLSDGVVGLRPWTRRDRSELQRWPATDYPAHWGAGRPNGARTSFAIDALPAGQELGQLVGRLTLREEHEGAARLGIYLRADSVNRGYGRAALVLARQLCGDSILRIDVAADNVRAVRCYQRAGWRIIETVRRGEHIYFEMA